nr:PREDICTED: uncharacterized protein LOC109034002 [Bemisia tabaci]
MKKKLVILFSENCRSVRWLTSICLLFILLPRIYSFQDATMHVKPDEENGLRKNSSTLSHSILGSPAMESGLLIGQQERTISFNDPSVENIQNTRYVPEALPLEDLELGGDYNTAIVKEGLEREGPNDVDEERFQDLDAREKREAKEVIGEQTNNNIEIEPTKVERRTNRIRFPNEDEEQDNGEPVADENRKIYLSQIRPTKPMHDFGDVRSEMSKSILFDGDELASNSGEAKGASSLTRTRSSSNLTKPNFARSLTNASDPNPKASPDRSSEGLASGEEGSSMTPRNSDDRKTGGSDIQDIITGFVKLLNGNSQLPIPSGPSPSGSGSGRPLQPSRTRINNRGPPRITDVPPILFDPPLPPPPSLKPPASISTKIPPPYPFDIPEPLKPLSSTPNSVGRPQQTSPISASSGEIIQPTKSNIEDNSSVFGSRPAFEYNNPSNNALNPSQNQSHAKPLYSANRKPQLGPESKPKPSAESSEESQEDKPTHNRKPIGSHSNAAENNVEKKQSSRPNLKNPELAFDKSSAEHSRPTERIQTVENNSITKNQEMPFIHPSKITSMTNPLPTIIEEKLVEGSFSNRNNTYSVNNKSNPTATANKETHSSASSQSKAQTPADKSEFADVKPSTHRPSLPPPSYQSFIERVNISKSSSNSSHPKPGPGAFVAKTSEEREKIVPSPTKTVQLGSSTVSPEIDAGLGLNFATGIGAAVAVLEPSIQDIPFQDTHQPTKWPQKNLDQATAVKRPPVTDTSFPYLPRPGIVLDDPEYKPGGQQRPIITAPPTRHQSVKGDIFDVTVSAIQGPSGQSGGGGSHPGQSFVYPVEVDRVQLANHGNGAGEVSVITTAVGGQHFVSIDGKRTYMNLFGEPTNSNSAPSINPTRSSLYGSGSYQTSQLPSKPSKSTPWRRPTHPTVRIDTCIVGDDSTCDAVQHERCRTEMGVSSCHCRPGYSRRKHREPCHRIVSVVMSMRVDRMHEQRVTWNDKFKDIDSQEYQQLEYEAIRAMDSAMSMTPFSDVFLGSRVNNMYTQRSGSGAASGGSLANPGPVYVNLTLQLAESAETLRPAVKHEIQKHLTGVIHRRSNNIGSSALWVDTPPGSISQIHDLDECSSQDLHDCHSVAKCTNVFGSFQCTCPEGYRDPWQGNHMKAGRTCETCDPAHCNHRGECSYQNAQPVCKCTGSYYGNQCEIDGEVLGVAVGASVAAVLIIVLTLICLCAWSRRWNKEQKIGSPVFGYMPTGGSTVKTPVVGAPPYQVSIEDRLRWAQIADAMAHANHYGPEPVGGPTRPSSAMFGYTLPHGTHVPIPRLRPGSVHTMRTPESSTSEEEDRADLLGRNFQVPRPKSRSSVANQSGIYYDVDYEQGDLFNTQKSHPGMIPLSTYTMGRSHYFRT